MIEPLSNESNNYIFSIIIPTYNSELDIEKCISSVINQIDCNQIFEIIVIDDCSSDSTYSIVYKLAKNHKNILLAKNIQNSGPGIARNVGVNLTKGSWIIFLDSDDTLESKALSKLQNVINSDNNIDAIAFNWAKENSNACRNDLDIVNQGGRQLLKEYLSLYMDGSVIYTAIRKQFIIDNVISFASGFHEDVDYIFKVYWYAKKISILNEVIYYKKQRTNSIVNTISVQHIIGFMRSWKEIETVINNSQSILPKEDCIKYFKIGLYGVIATRAREIYRWNISLGNAFDLFNELYNCWKIYFSSNDFYSELPKVKTKYVLIATQVIHTMQDEQLKPIEKSKKIIDFISDIINKSWSCIDLHNSVFLAPDQIRTCCKRFFVENKMYGDVCLIDLNVNNDNKISAERILQAKRTLHTNINKGIKTKCDGCPFLEFKEWEPLSNLDIKYLSFEYHSLCNLKCSYCCDTYYGGKNPKYNVSRLLDDLISTNSIQNCNTIVWGGGEPLLGLEFESLLQKTISLIPNATQRVLTNSVLYSSILDDLLQKNKISITTSIDAGTIDTYVKVRGKNYLIKVLENLQQYAISSSNNITVKYIFTEENCTLQEVNAFISIVLNYRLINCNFQISFDFKQEVVSIDSLVLMIAMYGLLSNANCHLVYFDDLLWQRISEIHLEDEIEIKKRLKELNIENVFAEKANYQTVAVWGPGRQAEALVSKSSFFKKVEIAYYIDSRESKIGGTFLNKDIVSPKILLNSEMPIVITAVQNYPLIYKLIKEFGIDESRIVKGLIL